MHRLVLCLIVAIGLSPWALPAPASAAPNAVEVTESAKGEKRPAEGGAIQPAPGGDLVAPKAGANKIIGPLTVCVPPFGSRTINFLARGTVRYTTTPFGFFDPTMRVTYTTLGRSFFVDRFFGGGTESITITSFPTNIFYPVAVTIRGFLGQAGCASFLAFP